MSLANLLVLAAFGALVVMLIVRATALRRGRRRAREAGVTWNGTGELWGIRFGESDGDGGEGDGNGGD